MNVKTTFLLLTALLLTACGVGRKPVVGEAEALPFDKGQVWQLVSLRGKSLPAHTAVITLVLNDETGTLQGKATCNRYFADFTRQLVKVDAEGTYYDLTVSYFGKDKVSCPEADMNSEERYFALLPKADACLLTPYTLTLFRGGKEILKYELQ